MSIVKMKKLALYGLAGERDAVLSCMQKLGCVQIEEYPLGLDEFKSMERERELGDALDAVEEDLSLTLAGIASVARYDRRKKPLFPKPHSVSYDALDHLTDREELLESCRQIRDMETNIVEVRARRARLEAQRESLQPWSTFSAPLGSLNRYRDAIVELGTVPVAMMPALRENFVAQEISSDHERGYFLVAMHKGEEEETRRLLADTGFNRVTFPAVEGSAGAALAELSRAIAEHDEELKFLETQIAEFAKDIHRLELLTDSLTARRDRYRAATRTFSTREAFALTGWAPAAGQQKIEKRLLEASDALYFEWVDPTPEDNAPTLTRNNGVVTPFESITNMYSSPLYGQDIDPNAIMMPFYAMFFGMMVSDAAYGVILMIVSFVALRVLKLKGGFAQILGVLFFGGLMTLFWGTLFGSWFSIEGIKPILFSPMNEPISMLILCYSLGAIHVLTGLGIKAYMSFRDGDPYGAIFDPIMWMMIILGLPMLALGGFVPILPSVGKVLAVVGVVGILFMGSRDKNPLKRIVSGLGSLYGVTSYLSDILSYSRLFAMGLATGVIGMVFNMLAGMMMGSPFTIIFGLIIYAVGHVFNLGINTLGAYVHACRLQYIEFYGKFYNGGGRLFTPLGIKTKYVSVDNAGE